MISFFGPNFPTPQLVTNQSHLSLTLSSKHSIMASSSSSSSSKECSLTHTQNPNPNNFISNCLLLSSAFLPTPSLSPPFTLHSKPNPIHELHTTLVSAADGCFRTFNSFISSNPLLQNLSSFRNSFQIHCRNQSISKNSLSVHNFAAILPGDSVAGLVLANGISNFLNLYNTLLVCRLVLTWFPNSPPAIVGPLSTICDPYLNIFRGLIPPLGGTLDLSPILAFLVLNAFTSTAAALPAELPPAGASQNLSSSQSVFSNITSAQRKWMKRIYSSRSKNSTGQSDKKSLKI